MEPDEAIPVLIGILTIFAVFGLLTIMLTMILFIFTRVPENDRNWKDTETDLKIIANLLLTPFFGLRGKLLILKLRDVEIGLFLILEN